jgi:hypothetical protein
MPSPSETEGNFIPLDHILIDVEVVRPETKERRGHYRGQCKCEFHFDAPDYWGVVKLFIGHLEGEIPVWLS